MFDAGDRLTFTFKRDTRSEGHLNLTWETWSPEICSYRAEEEIPLSLILFRNVGFNIIAKYSYMELHWPILKTHTHTHFNKYGVENENCTHFVPVKVAYHSIMEVLSTRFSTILNFESERQFDSPGGSVNLYYFPTKVKYVRRPETEQKDTFNRKLLQRISLLN